MKRRRVMQSYNGRRGRVAKNGIAELSFREHGGRTVSTPPAETVDNVAEDLRLIVLRGERLRNLAERFQNRVAIGFGQSRWEFANLTFPTFTDETANLLLDTRPGGDFLAPARFGND